MQSCVPFLKHRGEEEEEFPIGSVQVTVKGTGTGVLVESGQWFSLQPKGLDMDVPDPPHILK